MTAKITCSLILTVFVLEFSSVQGLFRIRKHVLLDPPENVTTQGTRIKTNLYFEQKVDNFNLSDTRTWKQRYYISEDYYNETSRNHVFLLLEGESEATEGSLNYGAWIDTAKQYGALLIYLEHRYYGASQPFDDLSTENLQYLSSRQALADAANFIQGINGLYNLTSDVKWIVFGGSYAGALAAWLRREYPNLVTGAMASSAPLEAILDFYEYLQVVTDSLANHSISCVDNIKEAYIQLNELVSSSPEDTKIYQDLDDMFELCDSIETSKGNQKDLATLFEYLADNNFAYVVQYNGIIRVNIDSICGIMNNETEGTTELQRLAKVNSLLLRNTGENCTDYKYAKLVANLQNTTKDPNSMMRQWVYQTCTEFGFFVTSNQQNPIFGSSFGVTYYTDLCIDVFGERFNETLTTLGIETTNKRYGGKNISVSNIVYFNGDVDPWHVLGKLETFQEIKDTVILVEGVAHCANMGPPNSNDSEGLTAARKEIDKLIGQWLGVVPYADSNDNNNNDNDDDDDGSVDDFLFD